MKLSKVQKSAMMLAVAVAMAGQVAQAATQTKAGGPTSTQQTQAAKGAAAQSAQQAGKAQGNSTAAQRARTGSFKPAGQVQVQQKTSKSRTSLAPESSELSSLKAANMGLDNQALVRVEKEMQAQKPSEADIQKLESQAAIGVESAIEALDNMDFDTLVTDGVSQSKSWSPEVKGNLDFVLQRAGAYLNGTERMMDSKGNPVTSPSRGQALRQAAKDLEIETAKRGADKKVVLNIRDIRKWCKKKI